MCLSLFVVLMLARAYADVVADVLPCQLARAVGDGGRVPVVTCVCFIYHVCVCYCV